MAFQSSVPPSVIAKLAKSADGDEDDGEPATKKREDYKKVIGTEHFQWCALFKNCLCTSFDRKTGVLRCDIFNFSSKSLRRCERLAQLPP